MGQIELCETWVVEDLANKQTQLIVVNLRPVDVKRLQRLALLDALGQQLAVFLGEFEQLPLEVHAAVTDPKDHAKLLQVGQQWYDLVEVEVVTVGLGFYFFFFKVLILFLDKLVEYMSERDEHNSSVPLVLNTWHTLNLSQL